jgi:hypothetical protein
MIGLGVPVLAKYQIRHIRPRPRLLRRPSSQPCGIGATLRSEAGAPPTRAPLQRGGRAVYRTCGARHRRLARYHPSRAVMMGGFLVSAPSRHGSWVPRRPLLEVGQTWAGQATTSASDPKRMRWMAPAHGIWVPKCEGHQAFTSKMGAIRYADYHDRPRFGQERFSGPRH